MATFKTLQGDVVVTISPTELRAFLADSGGPVLRYLLLLGERVKVRALELVPRKTGKLASHILKRVVSLDGFPVVIVGVDGGQVPYALYVHQGTPPHVISPRSSDGRLAFYSKRYGRVIRLKPGQSVNHPGTKPRPFLRRALEVISG